MDTYKHRGRFALALGSGISLILLVLVGIATWTETAEAGHFVGRRRHHHAKGPECPPPLDPGWAGAWYWQRSPEQERRVVASLYNRYCIRCHGVDGRGVWDIPDVPDFSNARWQATRPDAYLARVIIEGRGAVMPPFRGTFTLEESWAMARYLRTFIPTAAISRPDLGPAVAPPVVSPEAAPRDQTPLPPSPPESDSPGPFSPTL